MSEQLQDMHRQETESIRAFCRLVPKGHRGALWIDTVKSGWNEGDQSMAAAKFDVLVNALGGDAVKWHDAIVYAGSHVNYHDINPVGVEVHRERGTTIGCYMTELAFWALPFESEEEGEATVQLRLDLDESFDTILTSEGYYETLYAEQQDDGDGEESEIVWYLNYQVHITDKNDC